MTSLPTAFLTNGITAGLTLIESLPDQKYSFGSFKLIDCKVNSIPTALALRPSIS